MIYKEMARDITESFFVIFTMVVIGNWVLFFINGTEAVQTRLIFDLFLLSVLTSLAGVVLYSRNELKTGGLVFRYILHFVLILVIALAMATARGWVYWGAPLTVVRFFVFCLAVFVSVHAVMFFQTKRLADELNQKLKERYDK